MLGDLPWEEAADAAAGREAPPLLVLPCMGGGAEHGAAWAQHRMHIASSSSSSTATFRRALRSKRLDTLRQQLQAPINHQLQRSPAVALSSPCVSASQAVTAGTIFEPAAEHFKIPHGLWLREATSVAVDSRDRVYVFNRGNMPVLVFDIDGNLIDRWGNTTPFDGDVAFPGARNSRWRGTEFIAPHAITVDHEDNLWLVDDSAHCITKCDRHGNRLMMLLPEGALLGTGGASAYGSEQGSQAARSEHASAPEDEEPPAIRQLRAVAVNAASPVVLTTQPEMALHIGKPHKPPPRHSGRMFNLPTDIAIHPKTGELFITDGYGNSHVHRLTADGKHIKSWGEPGVLDGQFNLPHAIAIHPDLDKVIVCDRENTILLPALYWTRQPTPRHLAA